MSQFLMESTLNPADSDVALYIFLFLAGLCLEVGAYDKAYNAMLNWLQRRSGGRISSSYDLPGRTKSAIAILWDVIFMGIGLLLGMFLSVPFGAVWTLIMAIFAWIHVWQFISEKNKNLENRRFAGVPKSCKGNAAPDVQRRLEQLESLKSAGLVTDQEYRQKRQEILNGQ